MRNPVVTLCGSTRFKEEFIHVQKNLTLQGYIVLADAIYERSGDDEAWEKMDEGTLKQIKLVLDDMPLRKIDMSDEIFVINPGAYIENSTWREIEYALDHGKRVRFLEDENGELYQFAPNKKKHVQAIINNISFPTSLDELRRYLFERGWYDVEDVIKEDPNEWTVTKWMLKDDIVFFFHAKTAIQKIRRLETAMKNHKDHISDYDNLMEGLQHARDLYDQYGGKIYAIGRVWDKPFYKDIESNVPAHWHGKIFAKIGDIWLLENPVSIDEFSNFIRVSRQGSITPILGEDFDKLKTVIGKNNILPTYVRLCEATPYPLREINDQNWIQLSQHYRRQFFLEEQFRKFYVDYLLKQLADKKTFYSECSCYKQGSPVVYADNAFWLNGKICFLEVKLNIDAEVDFIGQLQEYSYIEKAELKKDKEIFAANILQEYVFFIDMTIIGVYDAVNDKLTIIKTLDEIKREGDIWDLKEKIKRFIA